MAKGIQYVFGIVSLVIFYFGSALLFAFIPVLDNRWLGWLIIFCVILGLMYVFKKYPYIVIGFITAIISFLLFWGMLMIEFIIHPSGEE